MLFMKTTMLFMKTTTLFMKTAMLFMKTANVGFWVITKYRSFFPKIKHEQKRNINVQKIINMTVEIQKKLA